MSQETALLVLSGKLLDAPFPSQTLDAVRSAVEREAASRSVVVARRVATLSPERFDAAPLFLRAGFEVVPADDEDVQATALLFGSLASPTPPTELLFALGIREPLELLRALGARSRRVLLTTDDVSPTLEANLDGLYDLRALLADDGIDWDSLDLTPWRADASPSEPALVSPPTLPTKTDDLCVLGPEEGPSVVELDAPAWNAALEKLLLDGDRVCSAYLATEKLADRFPELPDFFLTRRADFLRLLSPEILTVEENSATKLYHKSHPDLRPVAPSDAVAALKLGDVPSDAENADARDVSDDERPTEATSFVELADRAALVARQCRWSADRFQLVQSGADFQESIEPQDREFQRLAREKSTYLWPVAHRDLSPTQYVEAAQCYEIAAQAFALLGRVADAPSSPSSASLLPRVAQTVANAQCALKSVLLRLDVPIAVDGIQRQAYALLRELKSARGGFYLANLHLRDRLDFEETLRIADAVAALAAEFDATNDRVKERRACEKKIEYHLKKLDATPDSVYDWEKIVDATTTLCETFREPPSSLWFRDRLLAVVDQIPDDVETTDAFGRVVQEIDLFRTREEEADAELFETAEVEYSPALRAVRERYADAQVVFVGGTPQPHLQTRIEKRLNVRLVWSETDHGDSLERFAGRLRDDETRLFLVYIPWCSHKHSEEFAALAQNAGKDFVRLRKGTNPERIARAICQQLRLLPESEL
ncbi:MAG: hypothetical protein IKU86_12175 [Thermoguttaceae bacterium]|nr:hypothetical protein [Thermoguttaceae bacterium]